jgi:hypothetical protein
MKFFLTSISIFSILAFSRFIPHPPNFTSLLALSFYVPVIFGIKFLPILIISFALTDIFIGYHTGTFFTWGSVLLIGIISVNFKHTIKTRISGALVGACIFFFITNFGVWTSGMYGYTFAGLVTCFTLAIPFFTYSLISTVIFSSLFEGIIHIFKQKKYNFINC